MRLQREQVEGGGEGGTRESQPLSELPIGSTGIVVAVSGVLPVRRRLLEMGFCRRALVTAVRKAPLGDPIQFCVRGYQVSLRRDEAACVHVAPASREEGAR